MATTSAPPTPFTLLWGASPFLRLRERRRISGLEARVTEPPHPRCTQCIPKRCIGVHPLRSRDPDKGEPAGTMERARTVLYSSGERKREYKRGTGAARRSGIKRIPEYKVQTG